MNFILALVAASIAAVAIALLVQRIIRSAAARHAILLAALLLPPVLLIAGAAGLRVPIAPDAPAGQVMASIDEAAPLTPVEESRLPLVLGGIWVAGAAIAFLRITIETSRWRGIADRTEIVSDPVILRRFESELILARSAEVVEPTVIGIVEPIVVLPAAYDLEPAELDAVFAHELAHVARRDNLTALAVQLVCALFWFDPLHRIARRKLVELRERVCDELVLDRGCDRTAYVTALARSCETSFHSPAVACMSGLKLSERMESIMTHETRRHWPSWITRSVVTVAVAAAAIAFATVAPAPQVIAGETVSTDVYDFDVRLLPGFDGRHKLLVHLNGPEGTILTSTSAVASLPDVRTMTTEYGGKTYKFAVNIAANGNATATLEVREGTALVLSKTEQFENLMARPTFRDEDREGITGPVVTHRVNPHYPDAAKQKGIFGVVILATDINENGDVTDARVLKGLPEGLDQAAMAAVRQWKFRPAMKDGKPVATTFNLTINFRLE
jgi:bla regulator protein blaR1